jgi:hypothetical protein
MIDRSAPEQGAWQRRASTSGSQPQQGSVATPMTDGTPAVPQTPQMPATGPPVQQMPNGAVPRLPYSHGKRAGYGLLWAAWTAVLTIGGFAELFGGQIPGGLFALVLAALAGRYDYRIWTWRARRLLFLIVW